MAAYTKIVWSDGKTYAVPSSELTSNATVDAWINANKPQSIEEAQVASESYKTGAPIEDRTAYMGTRPGFDAGDIVQTALPFASWAEKKGLPAPVVGLAGGADAATLLAPPVLAARLAAPVVAGVKASSVPLANILTKFAKPAIEGGIGAAMVAPQEYAQTGELGLGTALSGLAPVGFQGAGMAASGTARGAATVASGAADLTAKGLESANAPALAATVRAGTEKIKSFQMPGAIAKEALTAQMVNTAPRKLEVASSIGIGSEEVPLRSLFGEGRVALGEKVAYADQSPTVVAKFEASNAKWQDGVNKAVAELAGGDVLGPQQAGQMLRESIPAGVNRIIGDLDISHAKVIKDYPGLQISKSGQDALESALIDASDLSSMQAKFDLGASDIKRIEKMSDAAMESGSYADLNELRRVVGTEIGRMKGVEGSSVYLGKLRTLYGGINDALMETLDEAAPGAADELRKSNAIITDVLKDDALFSATYGKDIGGEKVWNSAMNDTRKIEALRKLLTPEEFAAVKGAFVEGNLSRLQGGVVSAPGSRAKLNKSGTIGKALFSDDPESLRYLNDLIDLGEDIQKIGTVEGIGRTVVGKGGLNLSDLAMGVKDLATSDTRAVAAQRNVESTLAKQKIAAIDAKIATASPAEAKALMNERKALQGVLLPADLYQSPAFAKPLSALVRGTRGAFYPTPTGEQ